MSGWEQSRLTGHCWWMNEKATLYIVLYYLLLKRRMGHVEKSSKKVLTLPDRCDNIIKLSPMSDRQVLKNNFEKKLKKCLTVLPRCGNMNKLSRERSVNIENFIV